MEITRAVLILKKIEERYREILGTGLTGIYVHGSLAFGCFRWDCSDIDFLVVVNRTPTQEKKETMIRVLLELDLEGPPKGFEMSVLEETNCRPFVYPTPFALHYSNSHRERAMANLSEYCRTMNGLDRDLGAHVTVTREVGWCLCGKPVREVLGEVAREDYLDSIRFDVEAADSEILENPVYMILNLCRVAAFARENLILSKAQGGSWGMEKLSGEHQMLVKRAYRTYTDGEPFEAKEEEMLSFARDMKRIIG
ncbi:MAG: DUF4111 domain-containing protein [Lachnospiraceae bacterium]|nr:DUF4111 domain-containing protein [Lachnospiraceae bacterium]